MFNRQNPPAGLKTAAAGARSGARVAACPPDAASIFNQGTSHVQSGAPILVGLDNDKLMRQQYNVGGFGDLDFAGNTDPNSNAPAGTIIVGAAGSYLATFSFSASSCWTAAGIYFDQYFYDALVAAGATDAALVAIYPATAWNQNLIGYGQGNSNRVPLEMLTDPRQNCCPLIDIGPVAAGSPYVAQIAFTTTVALTTPILAAMFGEAS